MTQQATEQEVEARHRKGVRRTVTVLVAVVTLIFLLSFLQIVLME